MKHFLSVSKKLVAVCLAVLLAVVTVPALSVSATEPTPTHEGTIILHSTDGTTGDAGETVEVLYSEWLVNGADYYDNVFTKEGYRFVEWNYEYQGTLVDIDNNAFLGNTIHFYAQWEAVSEYTITAKRLSLDEDVVKYNKTIYTTGASKNATVGTTFLTSVIDNSIDQAELPLALPTDIDASATTEKVLGWYYLNINSKLVKLGSQLTEEAFINGECTLYFVEASKSFSISYDLGGGSWVKGAVVESSANYGTGATIPAATLAGFNLSGWKVSYDQYDSNKVLQHYTSNVTDSRVDFNKETYNVVVKAVWSKNYVVTYVNTEHFTEAGLETLFNANDKAAGIDLATINGAAVETDYELEGWYYEPTFETKLSLTSTDPGYVGSDGKIDANVPIYAKVIFKVQYVLAEDGVYTKATLAPEYEQAANTYTLDAVVGKEITLPNLYRKGYTLKGYELYALANNGDILTNDDGNVVAKLYKAGDKLSAPIVNGDHKVLTVVWTENTYTISYNYSSGAEYVATGAKANPTSVAHSKISSTVALNPSKVKGYTNEAEWYVKGTSTKVTTIGEVVTYIENNKKTSVELVAVFPANLTAEKYYVFYVRDTVLDNRTAAPEYVDLAEGLQFYSKEQWTYYQVDIDGNKVSEIGNKAAWEKLYVFDEGVEYKIKSSGVWTNTDAKTNFLDETNTTYVNIQVKDASNNYRYYTRVNETVYFIEIRGKAIPDAYNATTNPDGYKEITEYATFAKVLGIDTTVASNFMGDQASIDLGSVGYGFATYMPSYSIASELTITDNLSKIKYGEGSIKFTGFVDKNGNHVTGKVGKTNLPETEKYDLIYEAGEDVTYENVLFLYATWARADLHKVTYNLAGGELAAGVAPFSYFSDSLTILGNISKVVQAHFHDNKLNKNKYADDTTLNTNFFYPKNRLNREISQLNAELVSKEGYSLVVDTASGNAKLYKAADKTGGEFNPATDIKANSDLVLYIGWEAVEQTVELDENGGSYASGVTEPTKLTIEKPIDLTNYALTKTGYSFLGWYDMAQDAADAATLAEKVTSLAYDGEGTLHAYAWFKVNTYTITYDLDGGTFGTKCPASFKYTDANIKIDDPTKDGYTFQFWKVVSDNNKFVTNYDTDGFAGSIAKNVELVAVWKEIDTYDLDFVIDCSEYYLDNNQKVVNILVDEKVEFLDPVIISNEDAANHVFLGWYNFDQDDAETVKNKGYEVKRLYSTDDLIPANYCTSCEEYHIYAWFDCAEIYYTVTYDFNGGAIDVKSYVAEGKVVENCYDVKVLEDATSIYTPVVVKPGYNFYKWKIASTEYPVSTGKITVPAVSADVTLVAQWTIKEPLPITYDLDGGKAVEVAATVALNNTQFANTYKYKELAIYGAAEKTGYKFVGWSYNGEIIEKIPAGIKGVDGIKLVAVYEANTYNVVFKNQTGVDANDNPVYETYTQKMTYDKVEALALESTMKFTAPAGKTFYGWNSGAYADGQKVQNLSTGADVVLYAYWNTDLYTIKYENLSCEDCDLLATNNNLIVLPQGTTHYRLLEPTMEGHTFAGWFTDPNLVSGQVTELNYFNGSITLYAKWTKNGYKVTLDLGTKNAKIDGNACTTGKYVSDTVGTDHKAVKLNVTPELLGYVFEGWVDANGNAITEIAADNIEDVTVYASWSLYTYTQSFVGRAYKTFLRPTLANAKSALIEDPEGTAYWVDELDRGIQTGASLILNFYLSDEYQERLAANKTAEAKYEMFLTDVYTAMMGRSNAKTADEIGFTYWMNEMKAGQKYEDVIKNFARSEEFKKICEAYEIKNIIEK